MKKRRCLFQIVVADSFQEVRRWPHAIGEWQSLDVPIEFDWDEKEDSLRKAEKLLGEYVNSVFPGKDYKIYYWWWDGQESNSLRLF